MDLQAPDDDVDDDDRWIEEQIRKGTSGSADPTAVAAARSATAAAAASAAAAPNGAYARQLDGLGAAPSSSGLLQQQPEQLLRAGQDVILTLQQGVAQLQVLLVIRNTSCHTSIQATLLTYTVPCYLML